MALALVRLTIVSLALWTGSNAVQVGPITTGGSGGSKSASVDPPENFTVIEGKNRVLNLTWNPHEIPTDDIKGYIIVYQDHSGSGMTVFRNKSNNYYLLPGSQPWTNYTFFLLNLRQKVSESVEVSKPAVFNIRTKMAAPSEPRNIRQVSFTKTSIKLEWDEPEQVNGLLNGYNVSFFSEENENEFGTSETNKTGVEISLLRPYTKYNFSVAAFNIGNDETLLGIAVTETFMTDVSEPTKVMNLNKSGVNRTSIEFYWEAPEKPNGPISFYAVTVRFTGSTKRYQTKDTRFVVSELIPGTQYTLDVRACNRNANNESFCSDSELLRERTNNDAPSAVSALRVGEITSNSIEVEWRKPLRPNGVIAGYYVYLKGQSYVTTGVHYRLEDLKPATQYTISVSAFNKDSETAETLEGNATLVVGKTLSAVPPPPGSLKFLGKSNTTIDFSFKRPLFKTSSGPIKNYVLLVAEGHIIAMKGGEGTDIIGLKSFKTWNKVNRSKEVYRASPTSWSPEENREICRRLNGNLICTVGSKKNCLKDVFCNAPLQKNTKYRFKIRGYTATGWSETNAVEATTGK